MKIELFHTYQGVERLTIEANMEDNTCMWVSMYGLEYIETKDGEVTIFPPEAPGWRVQIVTELKGKETMATDTKVNNTHMRGFASLSRERREEVARMGGQKAQALKVAHVWSSEEARLAGQIGGSSPKRRRGPNKPRTEK